jgi:hypothetical protein
VEPYYRLIRMDGQKWICGRLRHTAAAFRCGIKIDTKHKRIPAAAGALGTRGTHSRYNVAMKQSERYAARLPGAVWRRTRRRTIALWLTDWRLKRAKVKVNTRYRPKH